MDAEKEIKKNKRITIISIIVTIISLTVTIFLAVNYIKLKKESERYESSQTNLRYNDEERRIFYMTNLDPYRMLANDRFYADFSIAKENFRADPYDNQLGEIEYSDHGLDFMEYDRHKEVIQIEDI